MAKKPFTASKNNILITYPPGIVNEKQLANHLLTGISQRKTPPCGGARKKAAMLKAYQAMSKPVNVSP